MKQFIINTIWLINGLIFSPATEFKKIRDSTTPNNIIYFIFIITLIISLANLLLVKWNLLIGGTPSKVVNIIRGYLFYPPIRWGADYLLYFCSIYMIIKICKLSTQNTDYGKIPYLIMSVSGIGLCAQLMSFPLRYVLTKDNLEIIRYIIMLWNQVLVIVAVKIGTGLSYIKASIVVIITMIIVGIFSFGIGATMAPYILFFY